MRDATVSEEEGSGTSGFVAEREVREEMGAAEVKLVEHSGAGIAVAQKRPRAILPAEFF